MAILVTIAIFIATLLAGWALYTLVELPMMQRWARTRKPVDGPAPAKHEPEPSRS
jgi:peptidoglycan/LPS O-acetylase OafA/YrhL